MHRKYLYLAVFFSGLTSLAVELAASRLLGNYFGASNLVWASIIGLILIYLTAGYFLGGYWADRSPKFSTFFQILIWGAFLVGLVPVVARPVLRFAADAFDNLQMGILFGSFVAVLILFFIPVTLLGTASPFAIRLAIQDARHAGRTSGDLYGISTLGSFTGTFLPVLLLIPAVGTYRTFMVISGMMLVVALFCLWRTCGLRAAGPYLWMPLVILALGIFGLRGTEKATQGMIYEGESAYNYIQVLETGDARILRLNEGQGMHSIWTPQLQNFRGPWEQVLAAPFFNSAPYDPANVKRMAIVGLAAGTTARAASAVYPGIQIDGIEIDPEIVAVAREYFDMNDPNLNVIVQDGRVGLEQSPKKYNIISVDAYRPPYIPWHMTTEEFFQVARDHLTSDGVLVINVGRGPNDRRLINAIASTIGAVFPSVYVMDVPETFNSIIYATVQPTDFSNLDANLAFLNSRGGTPPLLLEPVQTALANIQPAPPQGQVFTDDLAPIEWITNAIVVDFFLSGDVETLQ
ncbi:MAG: spermine synthase [Chloroflexi bacterium]|nr:MAG: spermine synthase [Chloroflexota bacterium]